MPLVLIPPNSEPYMYVRFNRAWLPYILGSLKQLMLQTTWQTDDPNVLNQQQEYAGQILYEFMIGKNTAPDVTSVGADEGCNLIRQNPDNPCLLETSIDGTNWCAFADLGKCFDTATGQPGADSRQPAAGGGCESYPLKLQANSQVLVPTVVNAGDVVSFSDIKGAGGDGTLHWYCPNGSIFFAGACVGSFSFNGADPAPAIYHMAVVAKIGSAYYDITAGPISVPGGIANEQVVIQVNDSVLIDNGGEYSLTAEVCNNAALTWTKTIDFALTTCGFAPYTDGSGFQNGVWTPGSYWTTSDRLEGGANVRQLGISLHFPSAVVLTSYDLTYDYTVGNVGAGPTNTGLEISDQATDFANLAHGAVPAGTNKHAVWSGLRAGVTEFDIYMQCDDATPPAVQSGVAHALRLTLSGNGAEPTFGC